MRPGQKPVPAAKVEMTLGATNNSSPERKKVVFNRPFVYAIINTETKLPVFIGTVHNPAK